MLIGLSVNHKENMSCVSDAYINAVVQAGGTPVLIPLTEDENVLNEILASLDGLVMTGGGDVFAPLFGEELHPAVTEYDLARDHYDIQLVQQAIALQMPVLGICRGMQVLNVALGGTLIQDIPSQVSASKVNHSQEEERKVGTHTVNVAPDSKLAVIALRAPTRNFSRNPLKSSQSVEGLQIKPAMTVNSFHHQAVGKLAEGMKAVAWAEDGVVEAIEPEAGKQFIFGVQWHPEHRALAGYEPDKKLFRQFISDAELFRRTKEIHSRIYTIDSHCDTPMFFPYKIDIGQKNKTFLVDPRQLDKTEEAGPQNYQLKVTIPKMQEGMLDAVFMVAYLHQGERDAKSSQKAVEKTEKIVSELLRQIEKNKATVGLAKTSADLKRLKKAGKKAIFLGIENGYGLGKDIRNVQKFAGMGVRYITLSHNGDNDICDAANKSLKTHNGLSDYGKAVVREMNRRGVMVDISHTSEKTSFDVLEISTKPIIASHSSAKALYNHPRNISDSLMRAIAAKGGVIQATFYSGFLKKNGKATVSEVVDHIDYIVKTVGIDHAGIGSDFDGGSELADAKGVNDLPQITMELLRRGYSEKAIAKIWGGNLMRVLNQNTAGID
ncbi:MAG: membrane dipeptidase [Candidatus Symbiothrix sp.]|jgi:microsomal dipeptidase-like Zn-dependent dipeptidase/gamma-glutamyl-gamma-aminobutyrate hydrolase PuuD|nr:membrane dipeptidase [Candidatus Symbiothrix sp.]